MCNRKMPWLAVFKSWVSRHFPYPSTDGQCQPLPRPRLGLLVWWLPHGQPKEEMVSFCQFVSTFRKLHLGVEVRGRFGALGKGRLLISHDAGRRRATSPQRGHGHHRWLAAGCGHKLWDFARWGKSTWNPKRGCRKASTKNLKTCLWFGRMSICRR